MPTCPSQGLSRGYSAECGRFAGELSLVLSHRRQLEHAYYFMLIQCRLKVFCIAVTGVWTLDHCRSMARAGVRPGWRSQRRSFAEACRATAVQDARTPQTVPNCPATAGCACCCAGLMVVSCIAADVLGPIRNWAHELGLWDQGLPCLGWTWTDRIEARTVKAMSRT